MEEEDGLSSADGRKAGVAGTATAPAGRAACSGKGIALVPVKIKAADPAVGFAAALMQGKHGSYRVQRNYFV